MIDVLHREAIYLWYYLDIQFRQIIGFWASEIKKSLTENII